MDEKSPKPKKLIGAGCKGCRWHGLAWDKVKGEFYPHDCATPTKDPR